MKNWKYTNATNTVVTCTNADGSSESCAVAAITEWLAAGNTPLPADIPPTPTALEQIRALEQKHEDDQRKITRISILELALDKMCANPAMVGKTRAQVHELYSAASRGYRELFALEVECARLRKLIV